MSAPATPVLERLPAPEAEVSAGVVPQALDGGQQPLELGPGAGTADQAEQAANISRMARVTAWAGRVVQGAVNKVPELAYRAESTGAVDRAIEGSRRMSGRTKLAVLAGAHAIRLAAGVHEARQRGLSGRRTLAYASARSAGKHYASRRKPTSV